jgi:hypothetical protein
MIRGPATASVDRQSLKTGHFRGTPNRWNGNADPHAASSTLSQLLWEKAASASDLDLVAFF